ncbi:MAG: DUF424 domain-containing protein [Candidatus Nanoarchaeia archaeon]
MMIVKVHEAPEGILLAVCDDDILGKKFETDRLQLDLTASFYQGEEMSEDELRELLKKAYIVNIAGEKSIAFFLKEGFVEKANIIRIQDVPHAQIVLVH